MNEPAHEKAPAKTGIETLPPMQANIEPLIHTIRGKQVIIDSDLAVLYGVETKVFNQAVKRNERRFPDHFRFRLTDEEYTSLRSQSVTSKERGGRRYLPYAFTEQGVAMLSAVLRSDTAIDTSIRIMDAFVAMRNLLAENAVLLERLRDIETEQAIFQKSTDERFDKVFRLLEGESEPAQRIFFEGQLFDAFSLLTDLVSRAEQNIVLIDGYVDVHTLNILAKKREGVIATIYTSGNRLTQGDIEVFNAQYPSLEVHRTKAFHDRFLVLDESIAYHIGASLKDAGRKCFAINLVRDEMLVSELIGRLADTR
ncbi:ORF6N domain-containing protein [Raoultibacter massiliensis]|uniref:ORF6N domain-containing protein n=1 Tax=Raoultibacter massiliensis TaxID=1852371 RepID=A0ABV1J9W1_9ACTN